MKKKKLFIVYTILSLIISFSSLIGLAYVSNSISIEDKISLNATTIEEKGVDKETLNDLELETYKVNVNFIYEDDFKCDHNTIETDKDNIDHRKEGKEHFSKLNEKREKEIRLKNYTNKFVASYGPFITYEYEDLDTFIEEDYSNLLLSDNASLSSVVIENKTVYVGAATRNVYSIWNSLGKNYQFEEALADIGIPTTKEYTGKGIKIGSIEPGIYDSTANLQGITVTTNGTTTDSHATETSSIYGGTSGIANNASIHFFALSDHSSNLYTAFEDMLDNDVNVINMSAYVYYTSGTPYQGYTTHTYYADYYVNRYNLTHINSVGNDADSGVVNGSATGLNVIAVASNDEDKEISYFSGVGVGSDYENYLAAPTVTAPGEGIRGVDNISSSWYGLCGTSYSAPMVTGIVALLMEEYPYLKYNSAAVKSIISSSATYVTGQSTLWDEDAGFGLVNYERAREAAKNYYSSTYSTNSSSGTEIHKTTINIPQGTTFYYNSTVSYLANYFSTRAYGQMKIDATLTNSTGQVVSTTSYNNSNLNSIKYTNSSTDETYTLTISLSEAKTNSYVETYAYSYIVTDDNGVFYHTHDYSSSYEQNDSNTHYAYCACNEYIEEAHDYGSYSYITTSHSRTCSKCEYVSTSDHSFTYVDTGSNTTHRVNCVCGYYTSQSHTLDTTLKQGNGYHYYQCTLCDGEANIENCDYTYSYEDNNNDSTHTSYCKCGNTKDEDHDINYSTVYEGSDNLTHYYKCSKCDYIESFSCIFTRNYVDNGSGTHTVFCTTCNNTKQEDHTPDTTSFKQGSGYHYYTCSSCGAECDKVDCDYTYNYEDNKNGTSHIAKCECGNTKNEDHVFDYDTTYQGSDGKTHYYKCSKCDGESNIKTCEYTYSYEGYDDDYHTSYCVCGNYLSLVAHEYSSWTTNNDDKTQSRYCLICDYIQTSNVEDTSEEPTSPDPSDPSDPTDDTPGDITEDPSDDDTSNKSTSTNSSVAAVVSIAVIFIILVIVILIVLVYIYLKKDKKKIASKGKNK